MWCYSNIENDYKIEVAALKGRKDSVDYGADATAFEEAINKQREELTQ